MGKNENQMAKQACEDAADPKHDASGALGAGRWKQGEEMFGGRNHNNSSSKIKVIMVAKTKSTYYVPVLGTYSPLILMTALQGSVTSVETEGQKD